MTKAKSKAKEKRIARMTAFLEACGVSPTRVDSYNPRMMHALIGGQSRALHKFLLKAGWTKVQRMNYGNGEFGNIYRHPALKTGGLEITQCRSAAVCNKVCIWA